MAEEHSRAALHIETIFEDTRPIKSLYWPDDQNVTVGKGGVEQIIPYQEMGQMAGVTWFVVYEKGAITYRINAAHIDTILY